MPHKPGIGAILGIVSENGVAKSMTPVYLMDMRRDMGVGKMRQIAKQFTREDGGFAFTGVDPNYTDYCVMTSDEDGAEPKNALIQDRVQPIPVHVGVGANLDWYTRIRKDGAISAIIPFPLSELSLNPYTIGTRAHVGGTSLPDNTVILDIPEIGAMPGMYFDGYCRVQTFTPKIIPSNSSFSIEVLVDLDSFHSASSALVIRAIPFASEGGSAYRASMVGTINPEAWYGQHLLRLIIGKNKQVELYVASSYNTDTLREGTRVLNQSLASYSGLQLITAVFEQGIQVKLFVGGVQIYQAGTSVTIGQYINTNPGVEICGESSNRLGFIGVVSAVTVYNVALSQAQVLAHYQSLFDNKLIPLTTGYSREICEELPIWYYRFDDVIVDNGVASFLNNETLSVTNNQLIEYLQSSPFIGQNSFLKPANSIISGHGPSGSMYKDQLAFSGWVYFSTTTPTADETIIACDAGASIATVGGLSNPVPSGWFSLKRASNKKLTMTVFIGGSLHTVTFNTEFHSGNWYFLWINIRAIDPANIDLYVGDKLTPPALVETRTVSASNLFTVANYNPETVIPFPYAKMGVTIGNGLQGMLRDMAFLPRVCDADRIIEIWESKDTL